MKSQVTRKEDLEFMPGLRNRYFKQFVNLILLSKMFLFLGILHLKNCKIYQLSIYPDSFPKDSNNTPNWNDGLSIPFVYSTRKDNIPPSRKNPTSVKITKDIQSRRVIIDTEAIASAYTCSDILIRISTYRSILSDDTVNQVLVYNKTYSLSLIHI